MKTILATMMVLCLASYAQANDIYFGKYRVADSADACMANCSTQSASCKRVCPTTFNTPCLNACDSQAQTCQRGCQAR
jgi:hypothetical protein